MLKVEVSSLLERLGLRPAAAELRRGAILVAYGPDGRRVEILEREPGRFQWIAAIELRALVGFAETVELALERACEAVDDSLDRRTRAVEVPPRRSS